MTLIFGAFGKICNMLNKNQLSLIGQGVPNSESCSIVSDHLLLFTNNANQAQTHQTIDLKLDRGVIVGKLFDKKGQRVTKFSNETTQAIVSEPQLLTKEFWGRYVGALYNKEREILTLVRDPLGLSTIFYYIDSNGLLFSSDLSVLYDILQRKPALDWSYFAEYIIGKTQMLPITPFLGIKELLPGMSINITSQGLVSNKRLWDLSPLQDNFIDDEVAFGEQLLAMLEMSTKAWTESSRGVCVELSGGTDSSSVMILLRHVMSEGKKIIGVNYIDSKTPSSNEIKYAQEVANACQVPLFFIDSHDNPFLSPLDVSWRPNRPSSALLRRDFGEQLKDLAECHGCDEIMNGQGGDHVFLAPAPREALADLLLSGRLKGFSNSLRELCGIYRTPWWLLLKHNLKLVSDYHLGKRSPRLNPTPYLNPAIVNTLNPHEFYLKEEMRLFRPGKAMQIESLFHATAYAERDQRHQSYIQPFLSQPLIEMALKIPTYQSFEKGFDRIFLRKAVSGIKPVEALWRKIKGETTGSVIKEFSSSYHEINDLILNGTLCKSGIINKEWVSNEMVRVKHGQSNNLWPLMNILSSQRWLNQWHL